MAIIKPFKGIKYKTDKNLDISSKIAPPFDIIDSKLQTDLYIKDPDNIVRIILGKQDPNEDNLIYERASGYYNNWIKHKIMQIEDDDAFYVWEQKFSINGINYNRSALVVKVKCESAKKSDIIPHELTIDDSIKDRLKLFNHLNAQFSQVFSLYDDINDDVKNIIQKNIKKPILKADFDGVTNELYKIKSKKCIEQITKKFKDKKLYIADGHNRYETTIRYHNHKTQCGYCLMSLIPINDPGLIVLPSHRAVKSKLSNFITLQRLEKKFIIEKKPFSDWPKILKKINKIEKNHVFGFANRKLGMSGILRPVDVLSYDIQWDKYSESWKMLDVSALHAFVLNNIFKIDKEKVFDNDDIFYSNDDKVCIDKLDKDFNWVFFMRPTNIKQLIKIADNGEIMPPESTFFYPKFLSGFIGAKL